MPAASIPDNENERLAALRHYQILDTLGEQAYDDLTQLAASICGTPIALMSLVDADRQWFKSTVGLDAEETHRDLAFCAHAIHAPDELLVVPDASRDPRFADNALVVQDPKIRFYAGAPLVTPDGLPLGTLCVIDRVARVLDDEQLTALRRLARQLIAQLELRTKLLQVQQQAQQLEVANRELDDFAYLTSHDLKQPLRGMSFHAECLREELGESMSPEVSGRLESIEQLAERLTVLIDSLLEYSRAGRAELCNKPVSVDATLDDVVGTLEAMLEKTGVELRRPKPLPRVLGDAVAIGEVFRNLITNAMKYNDSDQKWIEVGSVRDEQSGLDHFYVRDNGIGIEERHQEQIFGIFKRLHARDAYGGGVGAGLCLVKRLLARHGGRIWLESQLGQGSTFWFALGVPSATETQTADSGVSANATLA